MIGYGIWGSEKVTYGRHIHQVIFFTQTLISETVHSIAAPLMRAGEVEDARLKGLYALQAGQTAGQLIREEKDAGYVAESLRHNASESANMWEKARDWDRADRIENSRLGKKNSFALDIALGSGKSTSEIESTARVIKGSMIHGENTVSVRADKDISVSGSRIEGKDVNLEAGRHILITAGENSTEEKQNTRSTSGNMGVFLGVEGIQGIRGGYSSGKGKEEETSRTYEDSRIKAENTLTFVSGKDTAVKGGKLEGDRVKGGVGGSLSLETVQDEKSYHEESHSAGITLSYDFSHGKSGLSGGLSKENIQSHYESASSQSGIYAGDEGFDISVKDNTHLRGAVIDSKGDAEKNTLRTGTLSWEDIENKAGYESGGMGISYNPKDSTTPLNARGLTPQMSPTVKDKVDSSTKAAIAKGTIAITDKKNQRKDISTLHRDTQNSLNRLKEIFDKSKVEEKQELIQKVSQLGNEFIHEVSEQLANQVNKDNYKADGHSIRPWEDGSIEKVMLHGALGAVVSYLSGSNDMTGAVSGGLNEIVIGYIKRKEGEGWVINHPDAVQAITTILGAAIGALTGDKQTSAYVSQTAAQWNALSKEQERALNKQLQQLLDKKDFSIDELISVLQIYEDLGEVDEHTASIKVMKENPYNFSIYLQKKEENSPNIVYTLPGITVTAHSASEINQSLYNQIAKKYGLDVQWNENDDGLENVRKMLADAEWKRYGGHTWFQSKSAEYFGYGINGIEALTQGTRYNYISGYAGTMGQVMDAMSFITDNDKVKNAAGLVGGFAGAQVGKFEVVPLMNQLISFNYSKQMEILTYLALISGGQYWGEKIVDSRREYVKYLLNGGYESINDIEFRKRLNQYHSAED